MSLAGRLGSGGQGGASRAGAVGGRRVALGLMPVGLAGLAGLSVAMLAATLADPTPRDVGGWVTVDRLGAALTLLVAGVGLATYRFSIRYLDGEARRALFLRRLAATVACAYVLMLATNLVLLFAAWSLTSLGLHGLLTYYGDRPEALRSARKKFLISRLGDLALVGAIALVAWNWGTLDVPRFLAAATEPGAPHSLAARGVGLLIVVAALTKSAQFPFHSWLPETMEAPTPVSALMHAGIINAGGVLLLRFAPLIARDGVALLLLATIGTLTAALGLVAMWAQAKVKRTLAWSTVSQMGFMMVQCGLGAFPAAALHIAGHGLYKAWSFLRSGGLPASQPAAPPAPGRALGLAAIGTAASVPALWLASRATGFDPSHVPGELALSAVVALGLGQVWVALLGTTATPRRLGLALLATLLGALAAFGLYRGAALFLAPTLGHIPAPTGPLAWIAATLPVVVLTGLVVLHACLPLLGRTAAGRALLVHALHGFYFGAVADRVVAAIWGRFAPTTAAK